MVTEAFDVGVTKGAVDDDPDENNEIDGDKLDGSPLLALDLDIHFGSNDASACVEISVFPTELSDSFSFSNSSEFDMSSSATAITEAEVTSLFDFALFSSNWSSLI